MQTFSHRDAEPEATENPQDFAAKAAPQAQTQSVGWHLQQAWLALQQQLPSWLSQWTKRSVPTWAVVLMVLALLVVALD